MTLGPNPVKKFYLYIHAMLTFKHSDWLINV